MSVMDLKGVVTAVVTPFKEDESLDLPALREYVEYVVSVPGVNGILTCGYSGEGGGLNRDEQLSVVRAVTETVNGRIPVISSVAHGDSDGPDGVSTVYNVNADTAAAALAVALGVGFALPFYLVSIPVRLAFLALGRRTLR